MKAVVYEGPRKIKVQKFQTRALSGRRTHW
jgi:hypothetical protein